MNLKIEENVQRRIEAFARQHGSTPADVVREAFEEYVIKRNGPQKEVAVEESAYEAFKRAGLIGCVKGGPSDLSTNQKYMEGFGRD